MKRVQTEQITSEDFEKLVLEIKQIRLENEQVRLENAKLRRRLADHTTFNQIAAICAMLGGISGFLALVVMIITA